MSDDICYDKDPNSDYVCDMGSHHDGDHAVHDGLGGKILSEWPNEALIVKVALGDGHVFVGHVEITDEGNEDGSDESGPARRAAVAWNALMRNGVFIVGEHKFTAAECAEWWA